MTESNLAAKMSDDRVVAVVPVRGLPAGKSRLAAVLLSRERNRLVRAMLSDTVRTLRASSRIDRVTVLSRDSAAEREAKRLGVDFLQEPAGRSGLNNALVFAQEQYSRARMLLIVPADLPLVTCSDIDGLFEALPGERGVVVAPSKDGGTNALLLCPPHVIAPAFGSQSADRHISAAKDAAVGIACVAGERWELDIDTPEDLSLIAASSTDEAVETLHLLRSQEFSGLIKPT